MHGLVGTQGFRPRCPGHLVMRGHLPQAERGLQRHDSGAWYAEPVAGPRSGVPLCLCSGGLGSRAGRPGSGEDQYKFPNSSHGASRGHTETLVQNQPRGLGALAAADGSQDRHRPDTDMRAPGIVLAGQGPPASPGQELRQEGWPRMLLPGLWQLAGKFGLNVVREKP